MIAPLTRQQCVEISIVKSTPFNPVSLYLRTPTCAGGLAYPTMMDWFEEVRLNPSATIDACGFFGVRPVSMTTDGAMAIWKFEWDRQPRYDIPNHPDRLVRLGLWSMPIEEAQPYIVTPKFTNPACPDTIVITKGNEVYRIEGTFTITKEPNV